jgi:phosphatidylinositol alpha-1,6-mannosyltransferase
MKNVLLVTLEYPPRKGGVAEYLRGLHDHLPDGMMSVMIHDLPARPFLPFAWLPLLLRVLAEARRSRPDALIVSHVLPVGTIAWIVKLLRGIPYVVIVHGMDLKTAALNVRKKMMARLVLKNARHVVANSAYTMGLLKEYGLEDGRASIVYPCPSVPSLDESFNSGEGGARKEYGLGGAKVILSVGRLVKRKGYDRIIRALRILRDEGLDARYLLVGDGPEKEDLRQVAKTYGVADFTIFAGAVPDHRLPAHYRAADVFVTPVRELPGDIEGFGIVFLEAAAYGLPVVATRSGGVAEAVVDGKTGLLLEHDATDQELARTVKKLFERPDWARTLGEAGMDRVATEFGWKRQAAKFAEVIASL